MPLGACTNERALLRNDGLSHEFRMADMVGLAHPSRATNSSRPGRDLRGCGRTGRHGECSRVLRPGECFANQAYLAQAGFERKLAKHIV